MLLNIKPMYFFISFAIGLLLVYIMQPAPKVVVKFPSPYNAGHVTYKDSSDSCYKYDATEVSCDASGVVVKSQPLFEDYVDGKCVVKSQPLFEDYVDGKCVGK